MYLCKFEIFHIFMGQQEKNLSTVGCLLRNHAIRVFCGQLVMESYQIPEAKAVDDCEEVQLSTRRVVKILRNISRAMCTFYLTTNVKESMTTTGWNRKRKSTQQSLFSFFLVGVPL